MVYNIDPSSPFFPKVKSDANHKQQRVAYYFLLSLTNIQQPVVVEDGITRICGTFCSSLTEVRPGAERSSIGYSSLENSPAENPPTYKTEQPKRKYDK